MCVCVCVCGGGGGGGGGGEEFHSNMYCVFYLENLGKSNEEMKLNKI